MGGTVQTDIDPRSLIGRKAFDRDGAKIGTVDEVYLDDETGEPEWAAVRTGLFSRDAFVPLEPSEVVDDTLRVPYERDLIKAAPDFGVGRHLSPEQELQLYHHYGLALPTAGSPPAEEARGAGAAEAPGDTEDGSGERAGEGLGTVNGSGGSGG
ncbi:PRC-barrel domain-containing protein [Streptomyces sp. NPDC051162]|uniref:PRC-barrel domain-containing protein n=1 Tax=Streptomyces sp. NPDC051162 TaxID=3154747 RepID=UPI003430F2EF